MPEVEVPSNGGTAPGYLRAPEEGKGPGVIVFQEWWGVDDHIRDVCDRFAAEGFVALAPDHFRGETTEQPDEAEQKMMALSMEQAEKDMRAAVDFLLGHDQQQGHKVGSVGFCLGGGLSVWAAAKNPSIGAAVSYYYVMPHGRPDFSSIRCPVLGHFGTDDEMNSPEDVQALEREMRRARESPSGSSSTRAPATPSSTTPTAWEPSTPRHATAPGRSRSTS